MTDADLIYNALLRAERRMEETMNVQASPETKIVAHFAYIAVKTMREEIGNGLAGEGR